MMKDPPLRCAMRSSAASRLAPFSCCEAVGSRKRYGCCASLLAIGPLAAAAIPQLHCCAGALLGPHAPIMVEMSRSEGNFFLAEAISARGRLARGSGSSGPAQPCQTQKTCKTRALALQIGLDELAVALS